MKLLRLILWTLIFVQKKPRLRIPMPLGRTRLERVFCSLPSVLRTMQPQPVSDVTKEGTNDFSFKINGHKHVFQAASTAERSSWIAAVEARATVGRELRENILGSEGYKKHFERYSTSIFPSNPCSSSIYPAKDLWLMQS